jgi:hypothetical protein
LFQINKDNTPTSKLIMRRPAPNHKVCEEVVSGEGGETAVVASARGGGEGVTAAGCGVIVAVAVGLRL